MSSKSTNIRKEITSLLLIVLVIGFIRSSIVNWYQVPTGSMIPTIKINDHVFANKLAYGLILPFMETQIISWATPQRGDIILFRAPDGERTYIKRVIGIAGDRIEFDGGKLILNGKPIEEEILTDRSILADQNEIIKRPDITELVWEKNLNPNHPGHYVIRRTEAYRPTTDRLYRGPWIVPEGRVFCVGDNRDDSEDSRRWTYYAGEEDPSMIPFIRTDRVYGKALFIIFSTEDKNETGDTSWFPKFRWSRFFQKLQ